MPVWMRRTAIALVTLLVVAGAAYYWLVVESHVPSSGRFSVDMSEMRRLAGSVPGEKPVAVHVEQVEVYKFPATAIMAGDGWSQKDVPVFSYQLVYPDHTAVIDTAMDEATAKTSGASSFDAAGYARMSTALRSASLILITHEHVDHLAGLATQPNLARLLKATRLTREQVDHPERMAPVTFPAGALVGYQPLVYDRYLAVAPGVVLIKSPGHTPGSQMVFVQKSDGTELLLLGDVAWQMQNIQNVRERARLVTWYFLNEDRDAVLRELAELHRLHDIEPGLKMIPGHDGTVIASLIDQKVLRREFQ
jgi:glyoxylase-like metal-dependent hydrolase (beta-lactamase superfamily II)